MSEFTDLRARLTEARRAQSTAAADLAGRREELRRLEAQLKAAQRSATERDRGRIAELTRKIEVARRDVDGTRTRARELSAEDTRLLGNLARLADPQDQLANLDDGTPILLFPVRLEVRFQSVVTTDDRRLIALPGQGVPELWIRIYPDDCQVDSFDPLLTTSEVENARAFWAAMWRAGKEETEQRGAWRALVGGSGSGRAAYIIQQVTVANPADQPTKDAPEDVILVIVDGIALTAPERAAALVYWSAVWQAGGDGAAEAAALGTLRGVVGDVRAEEILRGFAPDPAGWNPPKPHTRADVAMKFAFLSLNYPAATRTTSWTQAPKAALLPDSFVALLFDDGTEVKREVGKPIPAGLATGPDPSLPAADQAKHENGDLKLNPELSWVTDFARAVDVGMGIRIPLTAAQAASGFDRLIVVGIRFASDEDQAADELEELIQHHAASRHGFGLVPQGSPTNNTESEGSAFSWIDDPDTSYDTVFKHTEAFSETTDPLDRRDGEWLAEALGIQTAALKQLPHAGGKDQAEVRAMNQALWPATMGYQMEEMLAPIFSPADIATTRRFFIQYVSGRGPLPAVRVGNQPYGLLPAFAFSRYRPTKLGRLPIPDAAGNYLGRLYEVLRQMNETWETMAGGVSHVGPVVDSHQTLLDIISLHSGSVEYHQRYAESFDQLYNTLVLQFGDFWGGIVAQWLRNRGRGILTGLGVNPDTEPPLLEKFFHGQSPRLKGPVVDDVPLSETAPIRDYTADQKNYIEWLATSSLDAIRRQDFGGNPAPSALLYLFLRHAMMLCQWDAGLRFLERRGLVNPALARREPSFVHVATAQGVSESKFASLYSTPSVVTGDTTTTLAEHLFKPSVRATAPETAGIREVLAALEVLREAPTARLERLFAEHIDTVSYRLDAWKTGLATARLQELRGANEGARQGVFLGAFGWLENLRPRIDRLQSVKLDPELGGIFQRPEDAPIRRDPASAGYIHAPSLNHACTAAILKSAYRANASSADPDTMAVNLESARVREALAILEGIRNGQTLAALLGYRFERGLHDAYNLAEVDQFIFPLRQVFPLVAQHLKSTDPEDPTPITRLEARNVVDGLKLINHVRTNNAKSYPFGILIGPNPGQLPVADANQQKAMELEVDHLLNLHDAVADLVMAESVHQVVLGNFDRAAANTQAFSTGGYPPESQVAATPNPGLALTHRVALHLDPGVNPLVSPNAVPMTPRATAEASLNAWVSSRLPDPVDVVVVVKCSSPALASTPVTVTQQDLGLQATDLLYIGSLAAEQAMAELDDRILQVIRYGPHAHPDLEIEILYTEPVVGRVTFFELAALVRQLRTLLLKSRPVNPADMALPLESKSVDVVWDEAGISGRVTAAIADVTIRRDSLTALIADAADLDDYATEVSAELLRVALFGIPGTGTGEIHGDIRAIYDAIWKKVEAFAIRWREKSQAYSDLMNGYAALTTDEERFAMVVKGEGIVSARTTATPPADPDVYKGQVDGIKVVFDGVLAQFEALLVSSDGKLVDYAAAATAMVAPAGQHDAVPFDLADQAAAITDLRATLVARVTALRDDLTQRTLSATAEVAAAASGSSPDARVQAVIAAARRVLGEEMVLIPRFQLVGDRAAELASCFAGSAALLTDLQADGRLLPVDDWLYGLARVREKLTAWEQGAILSEAFGAAPLELTPLQLPFVADDRWVALEFDTKEPSGERLLYTGFFPNPYNPVGVQCGLLVDEWPEVVPATEITSGVAFHFNRPNSEPPQTMLLALPSAKTGRWIWDDLISTLNETLDAARSRCVEPSQVDGSAYAQLLPATLMAVTLYQISIATNLAFNNRIYDQIKV